MFVFAHGCINQGLDPECFSDEFRGRCEIFMCLAAPFDNSLIVGAQRHQIKSSFMDIVFSLCIPQK